MSSSSSYIFRKNQGLGFPVAAAITAASIASKFIFAGNPSLINKRAIKNAPANKITVFADSDFFGEATSIAPGQWKWLGVDDRDEVSAVLIPPGMKLIAWTGVPPWSPHGTPADGAGEKFVFTRSMQYIGDAANDRIDTLHAVRTRPKRPQQPRQPQNAQGDSTPQPISRIKAWLGGHWLIPATLLTGGVSLFLFANDDTNSHSKTKKNRS